MGFGTWFNTEYLVRIKRFERFDFGDLVGSDVPESPKDDTDEYFEHKASSLPCLLIDLLSLLNGILTFRAPALFAREINLFLSNEGSLNNAVGKWNQDNSEGWDEEVVEGGIIVI